VRGRTKGAAVPGNPTGALLVSAGMDDLRVGRRLGAALLPLIFVVAACGSAAAPSRSPAPVDPTAAPPDQAVSAPPVDPAPSDPGVGGGDLGGIKDVVPKPGQLDVRAVAAETLTAEAQGSTIVVTATWWSGVEPCNVLDSVVVDQEDGGWAITLREGHGPEDVACIAIAEEHRTSFEIPNVEPGTYTIRDAAGGPAVAEVTVP
jgi:hypothetical protein